jgi:hypothetical protein
LGIFSGLRDVAFFVQCLPGQTEKYESKPTINEIWLSPEPEIFE